MRNFLISLGNLLEGLWLDLVGLVKRVIYVVGHEWGNVPFLLLLALALGAAVWSLRGRHVGRPGG